jgi:hypothetical protein
MVIIHIEEDRFTAKKNRQVRFNDVEIGNSGCVVSYQNHITLSHCSQIKSKKLLSVYSIFLQDLQTRRGKSVGNTLEKKFRNQFPRVRCPIICVI